MSDLPKLPPPLPELDFEVTETMRQALVSAYRAMLTDMQRAIGRVLDQAAQAPVQKSESPGFIEGALAPQKARRDKIERVLRRLGTPASHFKQGGDLFNVSDEQLRDMAKQALAARRRESLR